VFDLPPLVLLHTLITLVGIVTGFVVLAGLLKNERRDTWTHWFLVTTILTSATGFILPATQFLPSHAVALISLVILAVAVAARYGMNMAGGWRATYVFTAVAALWANVFVLVVQLFLKVPALHALAPEGKEPPFGIAQGIVLVLFIWAGLKCLKRFHPAGTAGSARSAIIDDEDLARR
jgi:hypothetical protein